MLHHAEPKLFFCLMHMFELFELEFGACLSLNSKEENKRKGIRNSEIKRKTKEAQPSLPPRPVRPIWPAKCAPASPLPAHAIEWARLIGAVTCPRPCLSLSVGPTRQATHPCGCMVSGSLTSRSRTSVCPFLPLDAASRPDPPLSSPFVAATAILARRAHVCVDRGHDRELGHKPP
jgi:hypothetical protein